MDNENTKKWNTKEYILKRCVCSAILEKVQGVFPYSEDYLICPLCDSTYVLTPSLKENL